MTIKNWLPDDVFEISTFKSMMYAISYISATIFYWYTLYVYRDILNWYTLLPLQFITGLLVFLIIIVLFYLTSLALQKVGTINSHFEFFGFIVPLAILFFTISGINILIKKYPFLKFPILIGIPLILVYLVYNYFTD